MDVLYISLFYHTSDSSSSSSSEESESEESSSSEEEKERSKHKKERRKHKTYARSYIAHTRISTALYYAQCLYYHKRWKFGVTKVWQIRSSNILVDKSLVNSP